MRRVAKYATCTWTSITGPCCPSMRDSTTNRWNCPRKPRKNDSNPSDSPTPTRPCATSPHSPQASLEPRKSTASCCPRYCNGLAKGRIQTWDCSTGANSKKTSVPKANTSDSYATRHQRRNAYVTYYPTHDSSATHSTNPSNPSLGSATTNPCNHARAKASISKPRQRSNAMPATSTTSPTPSEPCADTKSNASASHG